tara:strand:- start:707 stop:1837 length:1131 start_codon:yes stop_codon:yes gene_type:complete
MCLTTQQTIYKHVSKYLKQTSMKKLNILLFTLISVFISCSDSGDDQDPSENQTIAEITTKNATEINFESAISGGIISNSGNAEITEKGVLISETQIPEVGNSTRIVNNSQNNDFDVNLSNLEPNTSYNIRAYAINEIGIGYGENINFTTTDLLVQGNGVTDIDNNQYPTIIYDGYEWSTKNLEVEKYRNGDIIPQVQDQTQWANLTTGAWCYYENNSANGTTYGKLYNYHAVNDSRGLAPEGWHVANGGDYYRLTNFLIDNGFNCWDNDTNNYLGKSIASTTLWSSTGVSPNSCSPLSGNLSDNNSSGFNALPAGSRDSSGTFNDITGATRWWTGGSSATNQYIDFVDLIGHIGDGFRNTGSALQVSGMSVRIVKD